MNAGEGLRRLSLVFKWAAWVWLAGAVLVAAVYAIVGEEHSATEAEKIAAYERETGKPLAAGLKEFKEHHPGRQIAPDDHFSRYLYGDGQPTQTDLLEGHFKGRELKIRTREWAVVMLAAVLGLIGFVALWPVGWVLAGFAGAKRTGTAN